MSFGHCSFPLVFLRSPSSLAVLAPSERALSDHEASLAQLLQKLEFFGEGKRPEPPASGAFAFQHFAHPITHGLPHPEGSGPRRNLTPKCSHFSSSPCRLRIWSSLSASRTPLSTNC